MARPSNPNNRYSLKCIVTGEMTPTNPKQFRELANRYNISDTELDNSYVSRKGRQILIAEKHTKETAISKYGIHQNVADNLKCLRERPEKPEKATKVRKKKSDVPVLDPTVAEAVTAPEIQPVEAMPDDEETVNFMSEEPEDSEVAVEA